MDDREYEAYLKKLDDETRADRVKRRREVGKTTYAGELPKLLWQYHTEVIKLYIWGDLSSVILFCASILELMLADKLIREGKGTEEVIQMLSLKEKTELCYKYRILKNRKEKGKIDEVRGLRNSIAHANAGKLSELAKQSYGDVSEALSQVLAELYLSNFGSELEHQALDCLRFTTELSKNWYGEKPTE